MHTTKNLFKINIAIAMYITIAIIDLNGLVTY